MPGDRVRRINISACAPRGFLVVCERNGCIASRQRAKRGHRSTMGATLSLRREANTVPQERRGEDETSSRRAAGKEEEEETRRNAIGRARYGGVIEFSPTICVIARAWKRARRARTPSIANAPCRKRRERVEPRGQRYPTSRRTSRGFGGTRSRTDIRFSHDRVSYGSPCDITRDSSRSHEAANQRCQGLTRFNARNQTKKKEIKKR